MNNKLQSLIDLYQLKLAKEPLSVSTKRTYASLVRQFMYFLEGNESFAGISEQTPFLPLAHNFLESFRDGKASSSNTRVAAIKHFLNASGFPCHTLERPKTKLSMLEPLNRRQSQRFLETAAGFQPRDKAIAFLLAGTGIRLKDCVRLNFGCLKCSDDSCVLTVVRCGGRQQLPLDAQTQSALVEYWNYLCTAYGGIHDNGEPQGLIADELGLPLFVDKSGKRISMRSLTASIKKIGWKANLIVTPAILRATWLINIARKTNDIVELAYLGGFDSLEAAKRVRKACENSFMICALS